MTLISRRKCPSALVLHNQAVAVLRDVCIHVRIRNSVCIPAALQIKTGFPLMFS